MPAKNKQIKIKSGNVFQVINLGFERTSLYFLTPTKQGGLTCGVVYNYDSFTVLKTENDHDTKSINLYVMILGRDTPVCGWFSVQPNRIQKLADWIKRA